MKNYFLKGFISLLFYAIALSYASAAINSFSSGSHFIWSTLAIVLAVIFTFLGTAALFIKIH